LSLSGESSQAATSHDAAAGFPFPAKGRSASKLSVPTPERALVSDAAPNLNIGMDIWGARPPAKAETSEQGEVNAGVSFQHAGALSQMVWLSCM
jgi:plant G-box-binding factor